jgi:gamma-glutamylcyclotransferase (GGCT)/AIG2-like uncharacterized protein YtfP
VFEQGFHNSSYLDSARFLGEHSTGPEFSMYDFGTYPAVCASGTPRIIGELNEINEQHLASTDRLEWYPDFYQRVLIGTEHGNGDRHSSSTFTAGFQFVRVLSVYA